MAIQAQAPRFYCAQLPHPRLADRYCALDPDETRHARKVLRLEEGDALELFDGQGGLAYATIEQFDGSRAICHVSAVESLQRHKPVITVATAIPKGPRADDMINQLSQVGADRVIPLRCDRGVVDPRPGKLERFERQAVESAKQSGRLHFMTVGEVCDLAEVLQTPRDVGLIAVVSATIDRRWEAKLHEADRVLVLIGPEGGWSPDELQQADAAGLDGWTFGRHVMRIETAAPMAVALLRYLSG